MNKDRCITALLTILLLVLSFLGHEVWSQTKENEEDINRLERIYERQAIINENVVETLKRLGGHPLIIPKTISTPVDPPPTPGV